MAAARFLAIWFGAVSLGFPLVVWALGFRLGEGWAFLVANPSVSVTFCGLPFFAMAMAWLQRIRERSRGAA